VTDLLASGAHGPARVRGAAAGVPRPLAALLVVVLFLGLAWALIVPPWQAPDVTTHFAYAQSLASRFALPGDKHRPTFSSDQALADGASEASEVAFNPTVVKPGAWSALRDRHYLAQYRTTKPSRSDGGGPNSAESNPPLYYLYADLAYWADSSGNAFGRLYAMQIWGVLLLLATVTGGWLLAGEVLGPRRVPQLACAALTGLVPQETFIATSVNPDALMVTLWTFALWLGARVIRHGARQRDAVALCAVTAAAILTKATSYALLPAVALALLLGWHWHDPGERRAAARRIGRALLALVLPVLAWLGLAHALSRPAVNGVPGGKVPFSIKGFLSYVWQFYLPRLPFMTSFRGVGGLPLWVIWFKQGWADFGWLDVPMAGWVYTVLAVGTGAILVPGALLLTRLRGRVRLGLLAFFALALLALLGLLHITDYGELRQTESSLLQGRYLLPVVALLGLSLGFVVGRLPARWRAPVCGAALAGLLLLQLLALGTVARIYYT
jgi:4-amino-4-deoxy-L-arabinose transferase-like glycosyltransferase